MIKLAVIADDITGANLKIDVRSSKAYVKRITGG